MCARLSCIIVALLPIDAGIAVAQNAEAKIAISPGSRWALVKGSKGSTEIEIASLGFRSGNRFVLSWLDAPDWVPVMPLADAPGGDRLVLGWLDAQQQREKTARVWGLLWSSYELDLQTKLPSFSAEGSFTGKRYEGRCRMVGGHLEVRMKEFERLPIFGCVWAVLPSEKPLFAGILADRQAFSWSWQGPTAVDERKTPDGDAKSTRKAARLPRHDPIFRSWYETADEVSLIFKAVQPEQSFEQRLFRFLEQDLLLLFEQVRQLFLLSLG